MNQQQAQPEEIASEEEEDDEEDFNPIRDVILIPVEGPIQLLKQSNCKEIGKLLGPDVEVEGYDVKYDKDGMALAMFVDEVGKLKKLPYNHRATLLYRYGKQWAIQNICGPAILVDDKVDLTLELYEKAAKVVAQ
jgi:hypothetical protein